MPDPVETLKAAEILVKEGFIVLPYINADPVLAKRLEDVGTAAVMPLGSPIGTNRGIRTRDSIELIIESANIPVVVDAGLGAPSHASEALEMGADAVLVNTAIAVAGTLPRWQPLSKKGWKREERLFWPSGAATEDGRRHPARLPDFWVHHNPGRHRFSGEENEFLRGNKTNQLDRNRGTNQNADAEGCGIGAAGPGAGS